MATNELLKEHVTCPVCLDVFDDPHSLECRHIVCLPCLNRIKDNGRVGCPECRQQMPFKRIKPDFKTAKLAYSYKKEKGAKSNNPVLPNRQPTRCEVCKLLGKAVVCWCQTCEKYLCLSCELAHKGVPVTENHMILSEAEIIAVLKDWANTTMATSKEKFIKVEQSISHISAHIVSINANKETQEAEVDARIDDLMNQLENRRTQLKHELNEGNNYIIDTLTKTRKVFENHKPMLERSIQFLSEFSTHNDLQTLMAPTATATPTLNPSQYNKKIEDDVVKLEPYLKDSPVKVVNGPDCNVNAYVYITRKNASFADLIKVKCVKQKCIEMKHNHLSSKMCMVNEELWSGYDEMRVVNRDCSKVREIDHGNIYQTHGLTRVDNGDVILASCDREVGLVQFTSHGNYVRQILQEGFSDVCYYNERLYALPTDENKIYVCEHDDFQWNKKSEWSVPESSTNILANRYGVFISSSHNNIILQFSHAGDVTLRLGRGSADGEPIAAGFFKAPVLCGLDPDGAALLVVDYRNHTLQVYDCDKGTWQIVRGLEEVEDPISAIIYGRELFLANSAWLYKYNLR